MLYWCCWYIVIFFTCLYYRIWYLCEALLIFYLKLWSCAFFSIKQKVTALLGVWAWGSLFFSVFPPPCLSSWGHLTLPWQTLLGSSSIFSCSERYRYISGRGVLQTFRFLRKKFKYFKLDPVHEDYCEACLFSKKCLHINQSKSSCTLKSQMLN